MLNLSNITLITINGVNALEGIKALNYSSRNIKFADRILLTHENISHPEITTLQIKKLNSVDEYNDFVLKALAIVQTEYCLLIQDDGFVLNADKWDPEFLKYDYIGAPWPDVDAWKNAQSASKRNYMVPGWNRVGNGGFSLRSKKFILESLKFNSCEGYGEDFFLCVVQQKHMEEAGIKFAPIDVACKFSYENNIDSWPEPAHLDPHSTFGFHGRELINSNELISLKNGI